MGSARKFFTAAVTWLLLLSSGEILRSVSDSGERAGGTSPAREWQIATKLNFSSQIRLHPHVLLMITVQWSGESRSLMKELAHFVTDKQELGYLKLMVIYKNSEKMLADVLGASEGITLLYYHHSTSYKYQGQLRTQNILSSIYHIMSLQTDEVPLKSLRTKEDLDNFFQSTDKVVLLLEFCGWSTKLKNRKTDEDDEITTYVGGSPEKGFLDENLTREGGKREINLLEDQKGKKIEEVTYGIQSGLDVPPPLGRFTLANQSDSQGTEYRNASKEMLCTEEEFHQFKSFFSNFTKIAREHFLPPERQRFGLISDRSLLPFLGVDNPQTWLVTLQFSGCPNCSMVLQEGDDLTTILQMDNPLVTELHVDGRSLDSTFSANRPSVILFIDRSSDSSKVRGDCKFALQVLRKYASGNQLSYKVAWGPERPQHSFKKVSLKTQSHIISDQSGHQTTEDSLAHKILKFNDNMAIMIMNDGESISLDTHAETRGNIYDMLAHLLQRKKPGFGAKEKKISLVAKEAGFQLLSDDFEVQITDSPSLAENDPSNNIDGVVMSPEEREEPNINNAVDKDILVGAKVIAALDDEKKPQHTDIETCLQQDQKRIIFSESATTDDESRVEVGPFTSTQISENNGNCNQEDSQPFTCSAEDSAEKGSPSKESSIEKRRIDQTDSSSKKTSYTEAKQTLAHVFPREALVEDEAGELVSVIKPSRLDDWHSQQIPFKGSFFFSDGGYQLLQSLTGGMKVPSLVILDPVLQKHYVFSEETDINYFSLVSFMENFLNGSLTPYQRSALPILSSRGTPRPPFVNLDFHEVDYIPRVTVNTFCELIVGYKPCQMRYDVQFSHILSFTPVWKKDVLVLFSTASCGFCQRLELIVREVHRAFKNLSALLKSNSKKTDSMHIQDETKDTMINGPPSVFLMDCMLNDCGSLMKSMGKKEVYPALMLFPAENKSAITYGGDASVVNIIEFLVSHGRNSHYLVRHKVPMESSITDLGILWTHSWVGSKRPAAFYDSSSVEHEEATSAKHYNELITAAKVDNHPPISSHASTYSCLEGHILITGSVLTATDKLLNAVPFDNSKILILTADENQGFQGLIMNKRISWDVIREIDKDIEPLKQAPLSYGGPVRVHGQPLVSLTRKATKGYKKVSTSTYYGDPVATSLTIEGIKSGAESYSDYWFFLGYCSWYWNQLFNELAEGAWYLSEPSVGDVDWPDR
ncbi:uncharacterized protein M6B38_311070 [Iris pallida]|uniref:Thioredoxin domain-containing protein n=1 Tax=Iris pallida TaxID=29817 RepID=A0AAX6HFU5_IRIPA|nr:uncharacterized protein M6B38_311070 [Iris pallida]